MGAKRIRSRNPWRAEENKDLFDWVEGTFVVTWVSGSGNTHIETFEYGGNNMFDSQESRKEAARLALIYKKVFTPFSIVAITIVENPVSEEEYYKAKEEAKCFIQL